MSPTLPAGAGTTSAPDALTDAQLAAARQAAHGALDAAQRAWHAYAALCDVGAERIQAFEVFERVRNARRVL